MDNHRNKIIFMFLCFTSIPFIAYADAGLPIVLFNTPLLMLQVLVFIMLLEAFVYKLTLRIKFKESFFPSIIANFISTLITIPLFLVKAIILALGADLLWKIKFKPPTVLTDWVIYIFELILSYFISVVIEFFILKRYFKPIDNRKILRAVFIANTVTYTILIYILIYKTINGFI